MNQQIITLFVCTALLFSAQAAVVNITCSKSTNADCTSGFEYSTKADGFDDQTYCASQACQDGVTVTTHIADCTQDYTGVACSTKRCVANEYNSCFSASADCTSTQTDIKASYQCTVGGCGCTGVCHSGQVNGIKVDVCNNAVNQCTLPSYDTGYQTCESTTGGSACKCCVFTRFNVAGNDWKTGFCTSTFNWDNDKLNDIAAWNPREISQLVLLMIAGLFVALNSL